MLVALLGVLGAARGLAQESDAAARAFPDKPFTTEAAALDEILKPYVEMARQSYVGAKARFEDGLPFGHSFWVTVRLHDPSGNFEQVFVRVLEIHGDRIQGRIASDVRSIAGYRNGDEIECAEPDIFDWTLIKPDGSEEGNLVGKFMDAYQERRIPLIVQMVVGEDGGVRSARFQSALNHSKQDITYCIPDETRREAERRVRQIRQEPAETVRTNFTYLIYDLHEKRIEDLEPRSSKGPTSTE